MKHIMTKILVLYYSMYGHIEIMVKAVAELQLLMVLACLAPRN